MGKKKQTQKQGTAKPPSPLREERPKTQPPAEAQPTVPPPLPQTSTTQATSMVSIDALVAYLRQTNPNVDWGTTLAGLSQQGGGAGAPSGAPVIHTPTPEIPPVIILSTIVPTSSTPTPDEPTPKETTPKETSKPSPTKTQEEPLDISPLSAYQDPGEEDQETTEGEKAREEDEIAEEKKSEEGGDKSEETPVKETVEEKGMTEEEELNETARKQGLMTDEVFQSILDGVTGRREDTAEMAEGLDLASEAVGSESILELTAEPEEEAAQPVTEADCEKAVEVESDVRYTSQ